MTRTPESSPAVPPSAGRGTVALEDTRAAAPGTVAPRPDGARSTSPSLSAPAPTGADRGPAPGARRRGTGSRADTAGAAERTHAAAPADPQWVIELPAGMKLLSQNGRLHHMERHRRFQALKKAAWATAISRKVPRLERAEIVVEYQPGNSRDTDPDNVPPASGKPCIDGLVAAKVLPDDSERYVASVKGIIGLRHPGGRIVLHVTELPADGAA